MAVYVLVAFDNDVHAKEWIKTQQMYAERRRNLTEEQIDRIAGVTGNYDVVAMYKKPTLFCNVLDGQHKTNRRVIGFTKGHKYGWWVCAACNKPREMYVQAILDNNSFGFNLLPKSNPEVPVEKVSGEAI